MLRVSREELAGRWALTYRQDGYDVRAEHVPGHRYPAPTAGVAPDLEAIKGNERVLVHIIDSPESMDRRETRTKLQALSTARSGGAQLHIVVAAECAHDIKQRLEDWRVEADLVHVT